MTPRPANPEEVADDEVAPLNLSRKELAVEVPSNLYLKQTSAVPTSQTHTQGEINNTWGITEGSSLKGEIDDSPDEQKQTAALALCQLAQWKWSEQEEDSSVTTTPYSMYTETSASDVPTNPQISSATLHDNFMASNPAIMPQNKISATERDKSVPGSTETDKMHPSKVPDSRSALDVNCPTPDPEDAIVIPSEPKTKCQTKARRRGMQNAKRTRDTIPSNRVLRKRLRC